MTPALSGQAQSGRTEGTDSTSPNPALQQGVPHGSGMQFPLASSDNGSPVSKPDRPALSSGCGITGTNTC